MQIILYDSPRAGLRRLLESLAAAVRAAGPRLGAVAVLVGDSSSRPCLTDVEVSDLVAATTAGGLASLRYLFFGANLGSAEGNNRLLALAETDLVLFLNPDTVLGPAALIEMIEPLTDPRVGLVEARQVPQEHPKPYDRRTGETSWATMACLLVRRDVVRTVGSLDSQTFFLYCDDVDYSWRARLAGWTLCYRPSAVVFHDKRISPEGHYVASEVMQFSSAEGALLLARKYARPDVVDRLLVDFDSGNEHERRAVDAFRDRVAAGRVPEPIARGPEVADFVGRAFSEHRF